MSISHLKLNAKERLNGKYIKAVGIQLILSIIVCILEIIFKNNPIITFFIAIFSFIFSYGVLVSMIKLYKGEETTYTEFISISLSNAGKVMLTYLSILIKVALLPLIILFLTLVISARIMIYTSSIASATTSLISTIYVIIMFAILIGTSIYTIIKSICYAPAFYLINEKPELTIKEILNISKNSMKGNVMNYIITSLSFIGWYILILIAVIFISFILLHQIIIIIIATILASAITPYITFTLIGFYEDILDNNSKES